MDIKTILVPTDFSDYSEYAFQWALGLAADCKAKVILFYATPTMSYLVFPESVYYPDLSRMERDLIADARIVRRGARLFYLECWLRSDGDVEPCAHVTSTYRISKRRVSESKPLGA